MTTGHRTVRSDLDVFADAAALADAAADRVVAVAEQAIRATGRCVIALSGGSTPKRTFERLAQEPRKSRIAWSLLHVIWGDERCVAPSDAESNYYMAREALLEHVPVPDENIHRMRGEDEPVKAAAAYETVLRALLDTPSGAPTFAPARRIDLALLGLGDNGHTASIFPHSAAVIETERWVTAAIVDAKPSERITLTAPLLNAAAEILFLVSGKEKAAVLARVLDGPHVPRELPAQLIAPSHGRLTWMVDSAAAAALERSR